MIYVQLVIAAVIGGTAFWACVHLTHRPFRPVRGWEDQMLRDEVKNAQEHADNTDHPIAKGYAMGVHTAALMLGTVDPIYRQDRRIRRRTPA